MTTYRVQLPTGRLIDVTDAPDEDAARERVRSFLQEERRNAPRTGSSLESGIQSTLGGLSSAAEGAGRIFGSEGLEEFGRRNRERFEAAAEEALPPEQRQSFEDAETLGDYGRAAGQALGQNLPSSVPGLAGAAAGALAGAPFGPVGATGGALIGGLVASYPQLFGANRQRQMQENPGQPVSEGAAALTAVPQAALESVADRVTLGLAGALGRPVAEVGRSLMPRILRGLGLGAATEIPTEVAQQLLERAQAGLDVLSPDAMREYRETMFAAGVTGGAIGGTASGAFGARPQRAAPEETAGTETPPELPGRAVDPMPEPPEPITTPEEAQAFLAANPSYAVPPGVSDEGLVVRANDALNGLYRDQVSRIRQETLADFLGSREVTTQPGELDAEGRPTEDVTDRSRQAQTFVRNVLNAQGAGLIPEGAFTAKDVTDAAMLRLGGAGINKADSALVKTSLDGMVEQGLLTRVGKNKFEIPQTNVSSRGQPGVAPPTADQRVVPEVIERLSDVATKPTKANVKLVSDLANQVSKDTKDIINKYLGFVTEARQLTAERQKNLNNAEKLAEIDADLRDVSLDQAKILDQLEGIARGTLAVKPTAEPEFTASGVGRPAANIPPAWAATDAAYRAEIQQKAQAAQDEAQFAQMLEERPEEVRSLLQELSSGMKPRGLLSNQRLRQEAQARGMVLSQEGATRLFDAARRIGFVNGLGQLQNAPATQPQVAPTSKRRSRRATAPAPITEQDIQEDTTPDSHSHPAFEESDTADAGSAFMEADEQGREEPQFAMARRQPFDLEGLTVNQDGTFEYSSDVVTEDGAGNVTITGRLEPDAMVVQTAIATRHVRGKGYGIKAYQNLVDWAHARGLHFASDAMVSDSAGQVYASLKRRGYDVIRSRNAYRSGNSWVSDDYNTSIYFVPVSAAGDFATAGTQPLVASSDAELRERGERAFRRVLGANGRLSIQDNLIVRNLAEVVQESAKRNGISVDEDVSGFAYKDLALLSLAAAKSGGANFPITQAAIHEGWHVAENMQMFTPNEIRLLNANLDRIESVIRQYVPTAKPNLPPHEIRAYGLNARIVEKADFGSVVNRIYDRFVNFLERIGNYMRGQGFQTWRDVYDAFESGGMANREGVLQPRIAAREDINFTGTEQTETEAEVPNYGGSEQVSFAATIGRLPADTKAAHAVVKRAADNQIKYVFKWFASPILTMGKVKTELRAAADVQKTLYTRAQEMIVDTESLLADAHRLPPASVAKITRVWEQASRTRKAPNMNGLSVAEQKALQGEMASVQHAFNYFIEAASINEFMPIADKAPAVRERLEAFWTKHQGKHLWEIPSRELMVASPDGWRTMQKYERLRNPYYMPMVGRGTHFIAAYKAGPGGKRGDLVGMVAYTPRNVIQRVRGFDDPEADARAQLQREFGGSRYMIMERGQQFTQDAEARDLRNQGDFIAGWLQKFADASRGSKSAQDAVRDMTAQLDKAQLERIFRPNRDVLRAITPKNESSYILDVIPQYLLSMSKVQARRYTQAAYVDATKTLSPDDQAFLNDLRDYSTSPTEAFGGARSLAFFMYLGGAFDTAVVNLTQGFQTNAMLVRDGGLQGTTALGSAYKSMVIKDMSKLFKGDGSFTKSVVSDGLTDPKEKAAVLRAFEQGIFAPVFTNESRGQFTVQGMDRAGFKNAQRAADMGNKVSSLFGRFMQMVEEYNRLGAFLGAFRLAQTDPSVIEKANKIDNTQFTNAYDYAVGKVIDSQYLTTKEDRAYLQRFNPLAEVATQFMSYPLKTIEQYVRHADIMLRNLAKGDLTLAKAGAVGLMAQVLPLIGLAGIWALPGVDWLKEWAERITSLLWGSTQNFDAEVREMLGGGRFAEAVVRGIPYEQGWFALNRRLAIDPLPVDEILSASTMSLFGPVGGIADNVYTGLYMNAYQNGDYWSAAAALMPRAIGNVVRGLQLTVDQEQYTRRGNRIVTPEDFERVNQRGWVRPDIRQMLGFPAPEFVAMRESVSRAEEINRQTRSASERISKELAGYLVDMLDAQRRGDSERMATANRRFGERATEFMRDQDGRPLDRRINLNMSAIQRRALTDFYGLSSEEALMRNVRRDARPEVLRQRQMYQPSN